MMVTESPSQCGRQDTVFTFAQRGDLPAMQLLAKNGASLCEVQEGADGDRETALHVACAAGHVAVIKFLLGRAPADYTCDGARARQCAPGSRRGAGASNRKARQVAVL